MAVAPPSRPNFVLFLTDDQDVELGGWAPMRQAKAALAQRGTSASHWFAHTPVCCPSRAQLLTGRYFHNLREPSSQLGCMHVDTGRVNELSLGAALSAAGYTIGWFGKQLNHCPARPPTGFDCPTCWWFANGGGIDSEPGGYLNATFHDYSAWREVPSLNGDYVASTNGEYAGYTTSVIANKSLLWLRALGRRPATDGVEPSPFWLTIAPKAPHAPFTPAPWYSVGGSTGWVDELKADRAPPYNASAADLAHFHPMLAGQCSLSTHCADQIDTNFRDRIRTLLSVDDAVGSIVRELDQQQRWASTYFIFTSDHGYNLGQHRLPFGKHNVYDHAVRVPFVMRGPGITPGGSFSIPATHVDLAPTLLGLAGAQALPTGTVLDGRSIALFLLHPEAHLDESLPLTSRRHFLCERERTAFSRVSPYRPPRIWSPHDALRSDWRDFILIEYNSLGEQWRSCAGLAYGPGPDRHLVDSDVGLNTYRALRFVGSKRIIWSTEGEVVVGDLLYAEFTTLAGGYANFSSLGERFPAHYELFNLTSDPHQLRNLYYHPGAVGESVKEQLAKWLDEQFRCVGAKCA